MTLTLVLRCVLTIIVASAMGSYVVRGLRRGRILLGFRGNIETWGDRRKSPERFWFAVSAVMLVALGVLYVGLSPLWGAR